MRTLCQTNFDCVNNAECKDGQCSCRDGFRANGAECVDVNECETQICGPNAICGNTPGGYRCDCEPGFVGAPPMKQCKGVLPYIFCFLSSQPTLFIQFL